jgi:hypothetical protein
MIIAACKGTRYGGYKLCLEARTVRFGVSEFMANCIKCKDNLMAFTADGNDCRECNQTEQVGKGAKAAPVCF